MNKISIIGTGSVGSTIAYTLTVMGLASEIVMIDINSEKALGEALDIRQGTPFCNACSVYAGDYRDAADSDIVILTSGIARKPGQTRLELAQTNVNITKSIIPEITKYAPDAVYIIVSNPVDVLTYTFHKFSDIPESHIIGSGTLLDTARLRARIAEYLSVSQKNVHAYVFGEHGDTSFIPWSMVTVEGIKLDEYTKGARRLGIDANDFDPDEVITYVRKSGGEIIKRKGATFYGVANSVVDVCEALMGAQDLVTVVSSMMHGEYGVDDVCTSCLTVIGPNGVKGKIEATLTDEEVAKFKASAEALKAVIKEMDIE